MVDVGALGWIYVGLPPGAAIEPRYRAVVLVGSGLPQEYESWIPEANPINFAAHIRAPKIPVQDRYDSEDGRRYRVLARSTKTMCDGLPTGV